MILPLQTSFRTKGFILFTIFSILSIAIAYGQQNLFNVPSSDITLKSKPFFQQQINFGSGYAQLNSTFSYGLGHNCEIGVNLLGITIDGDSNPIFVSNGNTDTNPVYPFFTFNFQKGWTLNDVLKLTVGTQTGISKGSHFGSYDYLNLVTAIKKTHTKLITGLYYGTETFLGPGERSHLFSSDFIGFQTGIEQEIIEGGDLLLVLENISGRHILGETTLGLAYYISSHWVASGGYQMANPNGTSASSLVIEFTYVPSAHSHRKLFRHGHHH